MRLSPGWVKPKTQIGIWCFSTNKHAAFWSDIKKWLAWNEDDVSETSEISTHGLMFQWTSTIKIQISLLIYYKTDIIISSKCNMFSPWYGWKIAHLALNNNHSLTHYKERDAYCSINYAYYTKPIMVIPSLVFDDYIINYQYTWKYIIFTLSFIHVYPFVGPS